MSIISCGECGGNVSTTARVCPHCGAKSGAFKKGSITWGKLVLFSFVFFIVIKSFTAKENSGTDQQEASASTQRSMLKESSSQARSEKNSPNKSGAILEASDKLKICKAAISTLMSQPVSIIGGAARYEFSDVSYIRKVDGQKFEYSCDVKDGKVVWAAKIDGRWGRWRNSEEDSVINYAIIGDRLKISEKFGGEVVLEKEYLLSKI